MSQNRALKEIKRFLVTGSAEVLSISGRWGVGKTYAWDNTLKSMRKTTPLRRYAYVSAFGLRSVDSLKTAIVQSTVSLDEEELEPTVKSFLDHLSSIDGVGRMAEKAARKGVDAIQKIAGAIPYAGKLADLVGPGAALFIRNQIICIDDIERSGKGLDVTDILGLVSSLRERRGCKVVLLLNEDGLGKHGKKYREYLEKVVDQAIKFEPTAAESAAAALPAAGPLDQALAARTTSLGIINIRVITRIRRFLSFIEPELAGLHQGVNDRVVQSIALLGWCVFEPKLSPPLRQVRRFSQFGSYVSKDVQSIEDKIAEQKLSAYGFNIFGDLDQVVLDGLRAGAFDLQRLREALSDIDRELERDDVREAIMKPFAILRDGFDDDTKRFVASLVETIEKHAAAMAPSEASDALSFLRELGRSDEADRLVDVYVDAQEWRPREFFAAQHDGYRRPIDPSIAAGLAAKLATMPLVRDPGAVLLEIGQKSSWNPNDLAFLATVPIDDYVLMLRNLHGTDLHTVIETALRFGEYQERKPNDVEVARRTKEALRTLAAESPLNAIRIKPYLKDSGVVPDEGGVATDGGSE